MKFAIDSCIMKKDELAAGNSKILTGFTAPFTATVVEKAISAQMEFAGIANTTEFGISNLVSDEKIDGDACDMLKNNECDVVFSNDFSGLLRRKISSVNGYYIKPTYGTVSRFGVIAAMTSADQIGVASLNLDTAFEALSDVAGYDEKDGTLYNTESYAYDKSTDVKTLRIGVPTNVTLTDEVTKTIESLKQKGASVIEFEIPYLDVLADVQYIISSAEISNNTNRFDGIKFGYRAEDFRGLNELYTKSRTEGFGLDAKLASMMGALVLSADYYEKFYNKSLQVRGLFCKALASEFEKLDAIILPCCNCEKTNYENSALTSIATLSGVPSLSLPNCVQLVANTFGENVLYALGSSLV